MQFPRYCLPANVFWEHTRHRRKFQVSMQQPEISWIPEKQLQPGILNEQLREKWPWTTRVWTIQIYTSRKRIASLNSLNTSHCNLVSVQNSKMKYTRWEICWSWWHKRWMIPWFRISTCIVYDQQHTFLFCRISINSYVQKFQFHSSKFENLPDGLCNGS